MFWTQNYNYFTNTLFFYSEKTFYICGMKQFLLVIGFVLGTVLFFNQDEKAQPLDVLSTLTKEAVMEDSETRDMQTCLAVLTSDMKNSNLLSPRRVIQTITYSFNLRTQNQVEKTVQYLRLKGHDLISKLLENNSITHHINYSALLARNGYHVFALRKLLI